MTDRLRRIDAPVGSHGLDVMLVEPDPVPVRPGSPSLLARLAAGFRRAARFVFDLLTESPR